MGAWGAGGDSSEDGSHQRGDLAGAESWKVTSPPSWSCCSSGRADADGFRLQPHERHLGIPRHPGGDRGGRGSGRSKGSTSLDFRVHGGHLSATAGRTMG